MMVFAKNPVFVFGHKIILKPITFGYYFRNSRWRCIIYWIKWHLIFFNNEPDLFLSIRNQLGDLFKAISIGESDGCGFTLKGLPLPTTIASFHKFFEQIKIEGLSLIIRQPKNIAFCQIQVPDCVFYFISNQFHTWHRIITLISIS